MDNKIKQSYDNIINLIQIESRKLSEDDSYELHEELKTYFNRLFESNISESHQPGDKVIYKGGKYEVVEEDEYIIKLKDVKTGKVIKVNYAQFKKQEMNESIYPLIPNKFDIADILLASDEITDEDLGKPKSTVIKFIKEGRPSEMFLEKIMELLREKGVDVSSIKAQPDNPQSTTPKQKPSIDPYEFFTPSKGYMGSSYRGD